MSPEGSVTNWIGQLRAGDQQAAQKLWERYVQRLLGLARRKLGHAPRRAADEDDVVQSAFANLFLGVREGRFPKLDDRQDLWQVLVLLTDRRATDQLRRAGRRRDMEIGESKLSAPQDSQSHQAGLAQIAAQEPTPDFAAQVAEQYQGLLASLGDDTLRQIAQWKMEGFTNEEIAQKLGCVTRTVERKLEMIRQRWQEARQTDE
ncbi:MAG: sigma-70 family RNA polymerase sigma factor [Planctomycetes bacterium]|nr:sigma-70 family RNA polymerase sigma factor [Planctomycetota bacterium]